MGLAEQAARAERFRRLHAGPNILVLPNVWDAASARIVEEAGFTAVATSSAAVAASLGYPDGENIPRREMLQAIERIAAAVRLPVSADFEAGFGNTPEEIAQSVKELIAAGAVGLNFEDSRGRPARALRPLALQVDLLQAIRNTAAAAGMPLVINARTDVLLENLGAPETQFAEAVRRAEAYREAGADCLFIPGVIDAPTIAQLVRAVRAPINILAGPGAPSVPELERLGVARVSFGSGPYRASLGHFRQLAEELRAQGTYRQINSAAISFAELQALFAKRS